MDEIQQQILSRLKSLEQYLLNLKESLVRSKENEANLQSKIEYFQRREHELISEIDNLNKTILNKEETISQASQKLNELIEKIEIHG